MAHSALNLLLLCSAAAGGLAEYKPADSMSELNVVEQALHRVENAKLSPEQKRATAGVVKNVEEAVVQLRTDKALTKAQKLEKTKQAIQKLQGLQAQWELSEVEGALMKVGNLPDLSPEQKANVKKVVVDVEGIAKDVETGKLIGAEKKKRVSFAIQELEDLQKQWLNATTSARVQALQRELAEKKVLLKKDEAEMKLVGLEKELGEKKLLLKKLTAAKGQAQDEEKQRGEDEALVAKLFATAQALTASQNKQPAATVAQGAANKTKPTVQAPSGMTVKSCQTICQRFGMKMLGKQFTELGEAKVGKEFTEISSPVACSDKCKEVLDMAQAISPSAAASTAQTEGKPAVLSALVTDLQARERKISASIERMDAEEKKGQAELTRRSIGAGKKVAQRVSKQEHRTFLKARAMKEAQRKELDDGIRSIQKGDVKALTKLMGKMQQEQKSVQAKTKGFLY